MPKRKRDEEDSSSPKDRAREKLRVAIQHGLSRIAQSLEQARRFERQKLGKREHSKSRNDVDGRRINVETAVLKTLDMRAIAQQKTYKNLVKTKSIANTGMLPDDIKLSTGQAPDKTTADLMARLFKQKHVTEAVDQTMSVVKKILEPYMTGNAKATPENEAGVTEKASGSHARATKSPKEGHSHAPSVPATDLSDSEEEFLGFSSRVASSSDGDADSDVDEDEGRPRRLGDSISLSEGDSISELDSDSEEEPQPELRPKPKSKAKAPKAPPTASAFLPSLSGGGYMSNSDSDATDIEEHVAPRKNRRGQKARQAIWEKKYKQQAKHLKVPPKSKKKDKRDDGWDAQKGAVGPEDRRRGNFGKARRTNGPSGGNAEALGQKGEAKAKVKHKDDEGPLHPSWEARKNAKTMSAGIGSFKGKKMTFD